jgi:hypothetical protein
MAWIMERTGACGTTFMGVYRDPDGHKRSAGSFSTRREAQRAVNREEQKVLAGSWHDSSLGDITFREYVETEWLPNKQVEASTRAAYVSNLDKHFSVMAAWATSSSRPPRNTCTPPRRRPTQPRCLPTHHRRARPRVTVCQQHRRVAWNVRDSRPHAFSTRTRCRHQHRESPEGSQPLGETPDDLGRCPESEKLQRPLC